MTPQEELAAFRRLAELEAKAGTQEPLTQHAAQPDYKSQFDSLPWYERGLIGMGKGLNNAARGVGDAIGLDLAPKDKAIDDSIGGFWGTAGEITGGILPTIPAAFIPGVNTAMGSSLLGAASGALLNEGDFSTRAENAGIGAAGGFIGTQIPHAFEIARRGLAPFGSQATKERIAGDAIRAATNATNDPAKARQLAELLRQGKGLVPGSQPTAAEIGESGGLSSLQQWASAADKEAYVYRQMENAAARKAALSQIAGTPEDMATAKLARKEATKELYQDLPFVQSNPDLERILATPAAQDALPYAKKITGNQYRTFGEESPEGLGFWGRDLQSIRQGMKGVASDPNVNPTVRQSMSGPLEDFDNFLTENLPGLREADAKYAELSRPINQMQIAQELEKRFQSALSDYGPMTRQTAESYAKALRDGDKLAANVTGYKGAKFNEIFEPEQLDTFNNIATELNRKIFADSAGNVGSNTFDKFNTDALLNTVGVPTWVSGLASVTPGLRGAMSGLRSAGNWLYGDANKEMRSILSQALLSPQGTADLIEKSITPTFMDNKLLPAARKIAPLLLIGAGNSL